MRRAAAVMIALALPMGGGARAADRVDPWAPGASMEPWPLITSLQRYAGSSDSEPDWPRAVKHDDPIVRTAAAAALGRVPDPRRRAYLDALFDDRVALVRETAHWAALHQAGQPTAELVRRILSESWSHHTILVRFLPPDMSAVQREQWLRSLPPGPLDPVPRQATWPAALDRIAVSMPRSEYDADEVVELAAHVVAGPGREAGGWALPETLEPHDAWRDPAKREERGSSEAPAVDVSIRVVGGDASRRVPLAPATDRVVALALDLEELPPDVYTLRLGHPLFLRVRRSAAQEGQGRAAARDAVKTDEALAMVSRLRVLAAAPALKEYFTQSLATYGYGFNAWRATIALARLADAETAHLVLPPLLAAKGFEDPHGWGPPDLAWFFRRGFGGEARPFVDSFVSSWRRAIEQGQYESLARLLGEPAYGPGTPVDRARLEVLEQLGHLYDTDVVKNHQERLVLDAALKGAAGDHPEAVASVLARMTPRAGHLAWRLQQLAAGLRGPAVGRLVRAVWDALPSAPTAAGDARSAVAAEAERLGVALPTMPQSPPTASEAERQLRQSLGHDAKPDLVDQAVLRGRELLAREPAPIVALLVAEAEMERGRWQEAARVAPDPAALPTQPASGQEPRKRAHAVRGRIAAARGALAEAARELAAAGQVNAYPGYRDLTQPLAKRIAALGSAAEGRVRLLPLPSIPNEPVRWKGRTFGSYVFSVTSDLEVLRFDPATRARLTIGRAPAYPLEWVPVTDTAVVMMGVGAVWRLDAGGSAPSWSRPFAKPADGECRSRFAADESIMLVKDAFCAVLASSTSAPGRVLWGTDGAADFRLVPGASPGVLLVRTETGGCPHPCGYHPPVRAELRLLDASTGQIRWSSPLAGTPDLLSTGGSLAVLLGPDDALTAYDLRDGRRLWTRSFQEPGLALTRLSLADLAVAHGTRVYFRHRTNLLGLAADDGRTLWTLPFTERKHEALGAHQLVPVDGGSVYWLAKADTEGFKWQARLVDQDGAVRLSIPPVGEHDPPVVFRDGTLLALPPYTDTLEVWAPK